MAEVDFASLHILVIDDESFMRSLVGRVLDDIGVRQVSFAEDGNKAFEVLKRPRSKIDFILCDLEMPEMDGFGFVKMLRAGEEEQYRDVPVLILTGRSDEDSVHDALNLGIQGYVVKPTSRTVLEKRMVLALQAPPIDPDKTKW